MSPLRFPAWLSAALFVAAAPILSSTSSASYLDDIGYTRLKSELGPAMPNGKNVRAGQVEHLEHNVGGYAPDLVNSEFSGKTFRLESGPSAASRHATKVGQHFYGQTVGVAPGINK